MDGFERENARDADDGRPQGPPAPPAPLEPPPASPGDPQTIAPVWHTLVLLAYIAGITWMSAASVADTTGGGNGPGVSQVLPRPVIYGTVLASEWLLFAIAYVGL